MVVFYATKFWDGLLCSNSNWNTQDVNRYYAKREVVSVIKCLGKYFITQIPSKTGFYFTVGLFAAFRMQCTL